MCESNWSTSAEGKKVFTNGSISNLISNQTYIRHFFGDAFVTLGSVDWMNSTTTQHLSKHVRSGCVLRVELAAASLNARHTLHKYRFVVYTKGGNFALERNIIVFKRLGKWAVHAFVWTRWYFPPTHSTQGGVQENTNKSWITQRFTGERQ